VIADNIFKSKREARHIPNFASIFTGEKYKQMQMVLKLKG